MFCRFVKRLAQLLDGGVQANIEVHKGLGRPEPPLQFFTGNDLTRMLQQHGENLERLLVQLDFQPVLAQFAGAQVNFKSLEANARGTGGGGHKSTRVAASLSRSLLSRIDTQPV